MAMATGMHKSNRFNKQKNKFEHFATKKLYKPRRKPGRKPNPDSIY